MKICICDDDKNIVIFIKDILEKYTLKNNISFDIITFYSGKNLIDYLKNNGQIDLLYLDIQMQDIDGISAGHFIRDKIENNKIQIVYISAIKDYSMQLFELRPNNFLIKPLKESQIIDSLNLAIKLLEDKNSIFKYKIGSKENIQTIQDILYFEANAHKIKMYTQSDIIEFYGNLSDLHNKLSQYDFAFCHKSFLININNISEFSKTQITMSNKNIIPISRSKKDEFMNSIMKFDSK